MILGLPVYLRLAGLALVGTGFINIWVPAMLGWREELPRLRPESQQVVHVHAFFIGMTCVLMGLGPLIMPEAFLQPSALAVGVLVAYLVFWSARLFVQFFIYDTRIWRGSPWKTCAFVASSALLISLVGIFGWALATVLDGLRQG